MAVQQHSIILQLLSDPSISYDVNKNLELQRVLSNTDTKSFNLVLDKLYEYFIDTETHKDAKESLGHLISAVGTNQKSPLYHYHSKILINFLMPRIPVMAQKTIEGNIYLFQLLEQYFPAELQTTAYKHMHIIGNYFVTGIVLGSGNFSQVFIGRHRRTAHIVAIKWINMAQQVPQARVMIEREVQMMKQIRHPNIVQLYDVITVDSNLYIVMEYCSGETLESYMRNNHISEKTALYILREICVGLIYLNNKDIIHRDIKPANILLNYDQSLKSEEGFTVKLADFTFAKSTVNSLNQTYCGTPLFMSPEMLLCDNDLNQKRNGDLWSVGVIFYQMLYRSLPYQCKDQFQLEQAIRNFYLQVPATPIITDESKNLLLGLLEKDASRRFSFEELESAIMVTKEIHRAEENYNKEFETLGAELSVHQKLLMELQTQNLELMARQEELLTKIAYIEQQNHKTRHMNVERESIINDLRVIVKEGL